MDLKSQCFVLLSRHFGRGNCVPAGGTPWPWGNPGVRSALGPNGHKGVCQTCGLFRRSMGSCSWGTRGSDGRNPVETGNGPGARRQALCEMRCASQLLHIHPARPVLRGLSPASPERLTALAVSLLTSWSCFYLCWTLFTSSHLSLSVTFWVTSVQQFSELDGSITQMCRMCCSNC